MIEPTTANGQEQTFEALSCPVSRRFAQIDSSSASPSGLDMQLLTLDEGK